MQRGHRTKAVLPVRIKGKDSSGKNWLTRLGSIRRDLRMKDEVTI